MTEPVILYGTQSTGETFPVQVDATGRLVAEGLQGPKGDTGDQGPEGPPGPPGTIDLPPNPFEGAALGWQDDQLAWIPLVPPEPSLYFPGRFNSGPGVNRSVINQDGTDVTGTITDYDAWFRSQSFFPDGTNQAMGVGTNVGTNSDWWDLDVLYAEDYVLSIQYWFRFASSGNTPNYSIDASCDNTDIQRIGGPVEGVCTQQGAGFKFQEGQATFSFEVHTAAAVNSRFRINAFCDSANQYQQAAYLQGYKIQTSSSYLLDQYNRQQQMISDLHHAVLMRNS